VVYEFSKVDGGVYALKVEDSKTLRKVKSFILKNDSPFFVLSADKRIRTCSVEDIQVGDVVYVSCHDREVRGLLKKMGG
jgi:magnesium-transporting ATPase (P-type)